MKDSLMSIVVSRLASIPTPSRLLLITVFTARLITMPPGSVIAAEPQEGALEEMLLLKEETVSIAVRHEQPISEAPSNVYVITDEDIRHSGATDLPTVLRRIPGLEVMQTTGADINVSARGDNQLFVNKMLVMVDGRSIYIDTQGIVFWKPIPVTLPEIKRIEVLIGPASVLYGFNAFDGIINIITKSPEEMKGTTLQFGGGEFGTIAASAIQAGSFDKFGYRLSVGHDQNNQWRNRDALAFRDNKFNLHTEYALSATSKVFVSGGLVDSNKSDGPVVDPTLSSARPALGYAHIGYERSNFFIRAFWTEYTDSFDIRTPLLLNLLSFTDKAGNPISSFNANTYDLETQHTVELPATNRLTYGVNYRHNTVSANFLSQFGREDRLGLYVQDEWKATQSLTVVAGVRYDLDTFIHPTTSPRGAVLYRFHPDHTLRASISVAFRPPTMLETLFDSRTSTNPPLPPSMLSVAGSRNLSAEEIVSYEIGYQGWFLRHRLRGRGDLFFNHITNLVGPFPVSPISSTFVNNGTGSADIYGGEAGVEFLATHSISGFANFSYQEISQTFSGQVQRAGPRFKANAGLRGEWDNGLNGEVALFHVGAATYPISSTFAAFAPLGVVPPDPRVGSYNLLNLRAGYRFWHEKGEVAVSVFNALNDMHKEHPLGDTIGSRVMGWLTLKF